MSFKAKVAGIAVAFGVAVAGFTPGASASPDPVKIVMDRVNTQALDRLDRTVDAVDRTVKATIKAVERTGDALGLQIRF